MRLVKLPVSLLLAAAGVIVQVACNNTRKEDTEEMARRNSRPEAVYVETTEAIRTGFFTEIVSNGKVSASSAADIPFRVNGIISEINIKNGQRVNPGDILARIDDFEYALQLERARQTLEKAEVNFRDDLLSNFMTTDTASIPKNKIRFSRIRSGLNDALTSLKQAEFNLSNTVIKAPIAGVVSQLSARVHNSSAGYKYLCTVIADNTMEAEFPVTESEYPFIRKGTPVSISPFSGTKSVSAGTVESVDPFVGPDGLIKVRASFVNNLSLIEGMNVKVVVRIPLGEKIVVPKEALVIRQGRDVVFVKNDSLAIWRYVVVEAENSTSVAIAEGIDPGDLVIVKGNTNLAHETVVKEK
jgi:RND family efflux transporter MFP subunit